MRVPEARGARRPGRPPGRQDHIDVWAEVSTYQVITMVVIKKTNCDRERVKVMTSKKGKCIKISELEDLILWANIFINKSKEIRRLFDIQMKELEVSVKSGIDRAKHKENRQLKLVDTITSNQPAEANYSIPA